MHADTSNPLPLRTDAPEPEVKPDPLTMMAVDANELIRAIGEGRGEDVSRLVTELLRGRAA
ncbi:MAG: hypothetical protein LAT64_14375 [Phycisphaerales bacterium]|nr:hypothetical protein [Planctomycetota bacterium]MCH8509935.1 hypothetical protein [Phycisphaerales bacterium]